MSVDFYDTPVAVITGAANGIGFALAKACIQKKMHVVLADIDSDELAKKENELNQNAHSEVFSVLCDVSSADSVHNLAHLTSQKFKRVDWLFNNAGISGQLSPAWALGLDEVQKVLQVNLNGVINGVRAFLPILAAQSHHSHIINMASLYGLVSGSNMAAYAMSKSAIVAFTESLYFDLKQTDMPIDVSIVCPSFANTQLLANSAPDGGNKLHEVMVDLIKRSRPAEDIAEHIVHEIQKKTFYILPDREVKDYVEQRMQAILNQTPPHQHNLERVMAGLSKRLNKQKSHGSRNETSPCL